MTIEFDYSDIQEQCKKLAAFDANQAHTSEGDSLFDLVRITDRDIVVISDYITQAFHIIESNMGNALEEEGNYNPQDKTYTWVIADDIGRKKIGVNNAFEMAVYKAVEIYTLSRWMENKLPENAKFYKEHFETYLTTVLKMINIKAKPTRPE